MIDIKDCQLIGVQWDKDALETIQTVAKALLNMTELFNNKNIHIDCLMRIEHPKVIRQKAKKRL